MSQSPHSEHHHAEKESGFMAMPSTVSADTVEAIYHEMKVARLDSMHHVTLDFSTVDICTSPGIQLMVSLERTLLEAGGALKVVHIKPSVSAVFRDLGFEQFLQVPS